MKKISSLLTEKKAGTTIDHQTLFAVFTNVMRDEFGRRGAQNLVPQTHTNNNLIVKARSSIWANELWTQRNHIIAEIEKHCGEQCVKKIVVTR